MVEEPLAFTDEERAILPALPMIYVAWADGELTADELAMLHERLPVDPAMVAEWLNPDKPPSAEQLQDLLERLRHAVQHLGVTSMTKRGLASLGLEMARQDPGGDAAQWAQPDVLNALGSVETALGLYTREASSVFFQSDLTLPDVAASEDADFSIAALQSLLDGPQAEWKNRVRAMLKDPLFRHPTEIHSSEYRERTLQWCQEIARRGLTETLMPAARGEHPDMGGFLATMETLALFDLSLLVKFGVQFGLFGCSVVFLGDDAQKAEIVPKAMSLELPGCFAMTERGHGSNVRELQTTATFDSETDEFVIDTPTAMDGKEWIGNAAAHGQMATVFAQLHIGDAEYGVHAFLVPIRRPDGSPMPRVRIADNGHKMGLNGVDNGRLWFDQVRIPRKNLLSRFATVDEAGHYESPIASPSKRFFTMLGALVGGRIGIAASAVSASKVALTIAIRYSSRRRQFGPAPGNEVPILTYPTQQRRLMPRLAQTFALHFAVNSLLEEFEAAVKADEEMREIEASAAALKAAASWHCTDTVQACREACGGQGYSSINRFAALKADSDIFTTFEGDNIVLMQLVAKALLGRFRSQFSDPSPLAMVRQVARLAATQISEKNPFIKRYASSEHLRDGAFHRDLFAAREEEQTVTVARGFSRSLSDGKEPFDALNEWQLRMVQLAHAHIDRMVHDRFRDVVEACEEPALKATLNDLCDLYALSRIEADRGWLMENGYLEAAKSRAVTAEVDKLCAELVDRSLALVNAFAIPEPALAAPIAL
ncbi:MAG: acyl-CoA dehydrogenase [Myxococcota bacterium]